MAKTLYHSALVKIGATQIDVLSDILESKFKKGTYYVLVRLDGEERSYGLDSQALMDELGDRKGQRLTVEARGSGKDGSAELLVSAAEMIPAAELVRATPAPAAPKPAAASPRPPTVAPAPRLPTAAPQPVRTQPATSPPAPAPARKTGGASDRAPLVAELFRLANLELMVERFVGQVADTLALQRGLVVTDDRRAGMAGRMFIQLVRDGLHRVLPADRLIDVTPKTAPTAPTAPVAPAEPCDNDGGAA